MAFPAGLTLITVSGQVPVLADEQPASVTFSWPWVQGPTDGAFLAAGRATAVCDGAGEFTVELPATDDPGWAPVGWTYRVTIAAGARVHRGTAALAYNGGPVDLADVFNPDDAAEPGVSYALLPSVTALDVRVAALEAAPGGTAPSWESVTGKPAVFPPAAHTHPISDVTALQAALDGRATDAELAALDIRVAALEAAPGGGSTLVVRRATVTSGNLTMAAAGSWVAVSGGPQLVLPAAVGDYVEFQIVSALGSFGVNFIDLAVLAGGSLVRFLGTGTASPATEGGPPFYGDGAFDRFGPTFEFEVEAGDLSGGNVTVVVATKGSGGGTLYASADYPLRWRALNHGPVDVA